MSLQNLVESAPDHSPIDAFLLELARSPASDVSAVLNRARDAFGASTIAISRVDSAGELAPLFAIPDGHSRGFPADWLSAAAEQRSLVVAADGSGLLAVPIWGVGGIRGVLTLERSAAAPWTSAERMAAATLADHVAGHLAGDDGDGVRDRLLTEACAAAMVGSWEWHLPSGRVTWSDELFRLHGVDPGEDVTYERFLQGVHPDDRAPVSAEIEEALATGRDFTFDYRVPRADGTMRWLRARGRTIAWDGDRPMVLLGTAQDISDRRAADDALRAAEESYRTIFDSSNDAVFIHDLKTGAVLDANKRACDLHGFTIDELKTRGIELIGEGPPPFKSELALRHLARAAAGEPQRFEWCTVHHQTGEEMWVEVSLQRVHIRGEDRLLALVRDIRERKLAENALMASEEAYRTIFKHSSEGIWVHDVTGEMLDVNEAGCKMFGYTFEEMMTLGHDTLLYPGSPYTAELQAEYMRRTLAGEEPRFEWMGRHKDGSPVWGELTLRLVMIGGKQRILASARDISQRKAAEEALKRANEELEQRVLERTAELARANRALQEEILERRSAEEALAKREEHFRALIENAHDITTIIDAEGRVVYTTPSFERITGWSLDEMIGRNVFEFYHPEDAARDLSVLESIVAEPGTVGRSQHRFRHKDGGWRYLEAFGRTLSQDTAAEGIVVNVRDLTEHKLAEEALRASEEHFRRLIENASDFVMIVTPDGAITYVGPSVERILGYSPEEMLGTRPNDLVHPDDVPRVMEVLREIAENPGTSRVAEFRIRHKDGSWRVMENVGKTLSPTTAAEGVVANGRDVTERRAAEAALREAREAAERANQAKSEFLSRMSHELRTPMNSILGFAQVLETSALEPRQERCVQHILRAGRHLLQLINEVLQIAAIEAGRQNMSLEPVRVASVVKEAVELARPLAAQTGVDLEYACRDDGEAFVRADRQRLTQVILNLLSNAVKYNRPGGRVRIGCDRNAEAGMLRLWVEDTGRGIPLDRQADLFTPFARLGAENSEVEGTGLGLALSYRLAEAMGGSLRLERSSEFGSVFSVELAIAASPLQDVEEGKPARVAAGIPEHRPACILYIEDNLANLSLVETILWERPGWRTIPALQGQIGVELARQHRPDVILLDLHLPDIKGEEVLRRLRGDPRTDAIPVVVISADATPETTKRLLTAGAVAFLHKPIDVQEFLDVLERLLPLGTPDDEAGTD